MWQKVFWLVLVLGYWLVLSIVDALNRITTFAQIEVIPCQTFWVTKIILSSSEKYYRESSIHSKMKKFGISIQVSYK